MEERITLGAAQTVAGIKLIPLVTTRLEGRKTVKGFFASGQKRPAAIIIVTASARRAFKLTGEEVSLDELAQEYPQARGIISGIK